MEDKRYKLSTHQHERIYTRICKYVFQGKTPVDDPIAIILGGQPGSGKSRILEVARDDIWNGNVVIINGDEFRYWHPQYLEIVHKHEQDFAELTNPDARVWTRRLFEYAIWNKFNIAFEGTMRTDAICETMREMQLLRRYTVVSRVLAVPAYLSILSTFRRYELMRRERGYGRWVKLEDHDAAYNGMLDTISRIEREELSDRLEIYARPNRLLYANHVEKFGGWSSPTNAVDVIQMERERQPTESEVATCIAGWQEVIGMMRNRNAPETDIASVTALALRLLPD